MDYYFLLFTNKFLQVRRPPPHRPQPDPAPVHRPPGNRPLLGPGDPHASPGLRREAEALQAAAGQAERDEQQEQGRPAAEGEQDQPVRGQLQGVPEEIGRRSEGEVGLFVFF